MPDGICPFATFVPGVTTFSPGFVDRVGFCDHTAGGFFGTLKSAGFWNGAGVSVHFSISKGGEIAQTVNIFDTAFAQGRLGPRVIWPPFDTMGRGNPNGYLISTEHEDETEINMVWPEEMYQADLRLKRWCIDEVKRVTGKDLMRFGIDSLAGHFMFDGKDRANCPGTGWPRARLFADLTGGPRPVDSSARGNVYHQHDIWGLADFQVPGGQPRLINARREFKVPEEATRISVEWLPKRGFGVILHGNTRAQAGRFGWTSTPGAATSDYGLTQNVELDGDGNFILFAEDANNPIELFAAHVTAWW